MTRIIAIANQKGGVGKTTTTLNLGAGLEARGRSALLVDLDPQASLTLALRGAAQPSSDGAPPDEFETTIYTALMRASRGEDDPLDGAIQPTPSGLRLVPASIELSAAEMDLVREPLGVFALRDCLAALPEIYDYILLDCPPTLGILTASALAAANEVLIPLQADYLALRGVDLLLGTIAKMQKRANPGLAVLGLLLTLADLRTLHAREVVAAARATFGARLPVFDFIVPYSVRFKEAPLANASILEYAKDTPAAEAYRQLAEAIDR
ncbi:MAG TPA: AAA family ATPase [Anaerolineales bacterium]|nr:AAA family ATPase [Anaerolineales bacterium]